MARYYEVNALIEFIKQHTPTINGETTMECVERAIREAPTADVVPKSEVENINPIQEAIEQKKKENKGFALGVLNELLGEKDAEIKRLEYTLTGVMHSVDKWLDGEELKQDEVNRAITMREKTLRIIEELALKNHQLKEENEYLQSVVDGLDDFVLQVKQEVAREILNELRQEINDALECNQKRLKECEWVYDMVDRVGGKIDALRGIDGFIDELEEKYFDKHTESEGK